MKYNFEEAFERICDGHYVKAWDIQSRALSRKIWVAEWHIPGCLSESQQYCLTKKDAIDAACFMAEGEEGVPRGMASNLRKYGRFDCNTELYGNVINTVYQCQLSDLL